MREGRSFCSPARGVSRKTKRGRKEPEAIRQQKNLHVCGHCPSRISGTWMREINQGALAGKWNQTAQVRDRAWPLEHGYEVTCTHYPERWHLHLHESPGPGALRSNTWVCLGQKGQLGVQWGAVPGGKSRSKCLPSLRRVQKSLSSTLTMPPSASPSPSGCVSPSRESASPWGGTRRSSPAESRELLAASWEITHLGKSLFI